MVKYNSIGCKTNAIRKRASVCIFDDCRRETFLPSISNSNFHDFLECRRCQSEANRANFRMQYYFGAALFRLETFATAVVWGIWLNFQMKYYSQKYPTIFSFASPCQLLSIVLSFSKRVLKKDRRGRTSMFTSI